MDGVKGASKMPHGANIEEEEKVEDTWHDLSRVFRCKTLELSGTAESADEVSQELAISPCDI